MRWVSPWPLDECTSRWPARRELFMSANQRGGLSDHSISFQCFIHLLWFMDMLCKNAVKCAITLYFNYHSFMSWSSIISLSLSLSFQSHQSSRKSLGPKQTWSEWQHTSKAKVPVTQDAPWRPQISKDKGFTKSLRCTWTRILCGSALVPITSVSNTRKAPLACITQPWVLRLVICTHCAYYNLRILPAAYYNPCTLPAWYHLGIISHCGISLRRSLSAGPDDLVWGSVQCKSRYLRE